MTSSGVCESPSLRLSDDEVVALAGFLERPWPSPVATVDVTSSEDVLAAVSRGWRSLSIRELVVDGVPDPGGLQLALEVCEGTIIARSFLAETSLVPSSRGAVTTLVLSARGTEVFVNNANPLGVHTLGRVSPWTARKMLRAVTDATYVHGITGEEGADALTLCLVGVAGTDGSPASALEVSLGSLKSFKSDADGRLAELPSPGIYTDEIDRFIAAMFP